MGTNWNGGLGNAKSIKLSSQRLSAKGDPTHQNQSISFELVNVPPHRNRSFADAQVVLK